MRKLIVLTVILGLSTVANAVPVLMNAGDPIATGAVSWDVVGNQLVGYNATNVADRAGYGVGKGVGGITVSAIGAGVGSNPIKYPGSLVGSPPNAGDVAFVGDFASWPGYDLSAGTTADPDIGASAGDWYVFDLALVGGSGTVDLYDYETSYVTPAGTMTIIPEPATIVLLGLGGLLLRRRK